MLTDMKFIEPFGIFMRICLKINPAHTTERNQGRDEAQEENNPPWIDPAKCVRRKQPGKNFTLSCNALFIAYTILHCIAWHDVKKCKSLFFLPDGYRGALYIQKGFVACLRVSWHLVSSPARLGVEDASACPGNWINSPWGTSQSAACVCAVLLPCNFETNAVHATDDPYSHMQTAARKRMNLNAPEDFPMQAAGCFCPGRFAWSF